MEMYHPQDSEHVRCRSEVAFLRYSHLPVFAGPLPMQNELGRGSNFGNNSIRKASQDTRGSTQEGYPLKTKLRG